MIKCYSVGMRQCRMIGTAKRSCGWGWTCNLKFVHLQMATVKFRLIFGLAELLRKPKYLAKINMR